MINQLRDWIASYPGFAGRQFSVDALGSGPEAAAVYCKGEQVLSRQEDILGGAALRRRLTLTVLVRGREQSQLPQALAGFVRWAEHGAPVLGEQQTVRAEQGKLRHAAGTGITTYEIRVELEFSTRDNEHMR